MTPHDFLRKWRNVDLKERTASQSHFNDLCALLGVLDPISADPAGDWFTFEKGATKTGGGEGWADVWRRGHFAWEYKGPRKNLDTAFAQLLQYSVALENPPLLIVSDMDRIRIHTNWTNTVQEVHDFTLDDLLDGDTRARLKNAFTDPDAFKPAKTRQALTEETARDFAGLAQRLRDRGNEAHLVAHFVNQLVFCMFAEDVGLLPDHLFTKMLEVSRRDPAGFADNARQLFGAMARPGGKVGFTAIDWFNGGLFTDDAVLGVSADDIDDLLRAANRDWSAIDPSILGTLFERGLDPAKRSQLGAHYTDRAKIMMIVRPVIIDPLESEWAAALAKITALIDSAPRRTADRLLTPAERRRAERITAEAAAIHSAFVERLAAFRVLDPACGSGNFLYVALRALKDIEHRANLDAEALGLPRGFPRVGPECVLGIELNPYAAELARVSVWIGEIQWMRRNGFDAAKNPILRPLDTIECRDAVLATNNPPPPGEREALATFNPPPPGGGGAQRATEGEESLHPVSPPPPPPSAVPLPLAGEDRSRIVRQPVHGEERLSEVEGASRTTAAPDATTPPVRPAAPKPTPADWPAADVVIGNPPFLGNKKMIAELGEDYTRALRKAWPDVPGGVDLVCYWFAKAWTMIAEGRLHRAGLVATNSIRGGANRAVLKPIVEHGRIFEAWSDEAWTVDGAAVRVSMVCFDSGDNGSTRLDGNEAVSIFSNLTASVGTDLTLAKPLTENANICFVGVILNGEFEVPAEAARAMLLSPSNVNGRRNSDVVKPSLNGDDFNGERPDKWVVDFGTRMLAEEAAFYEMPFEHVDRLVRPFRQRRKTDGSFAVRSVPEREIWWRHARSRPRMRAALNGLHFYIGTPMVSSYRTFGFLPASVLPDQKLVIFAKDDLSTLGVLHSKFHEAWTIATCSWIGSGNDVTYSNTAVFLTFPFPEGLTPDIPAADYAADPRAQTIAAAAARLNELRENWLNPADLVVRVPEVVPGYPDRILPRDDDAVQELKKRTLTNLYNARPQWLANAHATLDAAVAAAYGWADDYRAGTLTDEETLARLFHLNQDRAS